MQAVFSAIAGLLYLVAFSLYILAVLRDRHLPAGTPGKIEPSKATWIIWASLDTITISGMYVEGTVNGQILGAVAGAWIVVVFALKYGTPGWTLLDKLCLSGAVVGIVFWNVFDSPILGVIISLSVVFLGSIPTYVSAWKDPGRENKLAWVIFTISCVCALIAVPQWTLADASQPITFFAVEAVMMYILFVRPCFLNNN
ncbi:MAG: hypothetical protein AAB575_00400 [Patescibacteria group bacterium]